MLASTADFVPILAGTLIVSIQRQKLFAMGARIMLCLRQMLASTADFVPMVAGILVVRSQRQKLFAMGACIMLGLGHTITTHKLGERHARLEFMFIVGEFAARARWIFARLTIKSCWARFLASVFALLRTCRVFTLRTQKT